jgi:aminoglycoside phosphotransferase (APT) family kinase protein
VELDLDAVLERVDAQAGDHRRGARVHGLRRLPGGISSLTYRGILGRQGEPGEPVVLKVAPPGLPAVGHRDMLRQARLLRRLESAGVVPLPAVLFEGDGDPPWYVMQFVDGDAYEPLADVENEPPPPEDVMPRALRAARVLARLQGANPESIGLSGDQVITPADELARWHRALQTVDETIRPDDESLHRRLARRVPAPLPPVVVHGDYRLGNLLFAGQTLTAVIDWELWALGDPRFDLAWLLSHAGSPYAPNRVSDDPMRRAAALAMPSPERLMQEYASVSSAPVPDLAWFMALAQYKTIATLALIIKNNRKRGATEGSTVGEGLLGLFVQRGHEHLSGSALPRLSEGRA